MEDKNILLKWVPLKEKIKTKGHDCGDGWWYVYTPFDNDWHHVPETDVTVIE